MRKRQIRIGSGAQGWTPKFTFHGFRYVQVEGLADVTLDTFTAKVIHSDMDEIGSFECSHELITRFHENTIWGTRGNFVSVPTDCPQRDERLGWTGDLQVFTPTASFLFDTAGLVGDWLQDLACEQLHDLDGKVPLVVPNVLGWMGPPPQFAIWGDVVALTPQDLHLAFDDHQMLVDQYASMTSWLDRAVHREPSDLWGPGMQLADWLDPRAPDDDPSEALTDPLLVANAYLVHVTLSVSNIARIIGKTGDASKYHAEYEKLLRAFCYRYITPAGRLAADTQTAYALALKFNLFEKDSQREMAIQRLCHLIENSAPRLGPGSPVRQLFCKH